MVPLKIVSNSSRFKPALNLNRVLEDLNRGSGSLNSISSNYEMPDSQRYLLNIYLINNVEDIVVFINSEVLINDISAVEM